MPGMDQLQRVQRGKTKTNSKTTENLDLRKKKRKKSGAGSTPEKLTRKESVCVLQCVPVEFGNEIYILR